MEENKMQEELLKELKRRKKSCFMGCLLPIMIILIIFTGAVIYVTNLPSFKPMLKCSENLMELGAATIRYRDLNKKYPKKLEDLKNEYLKDNNILYCPLDKNKDGYEYVNPDTDKNNSNFMIRCKNHIVKPGQPRLFLIINKNGRFTNQLDPDYMNKMNHQKGK